MTRFLLAFILLCSAVQAAITERYVSPAGSGAADGTSAANAMSLTTFVDYMTTAGSFTAAAGDRFNLLAGSYSRTTTSDTWVNGGTSTSPVIIRGYGSAITDGYQGRSAGGDLVTTNFAAFSWTGGSARLNVTGSWIIIEACSFTAANNGATVLFNTGSNCAILRSKIDNSGTGGSSQALSLGTNGLGFDCDITLTGASGGACAVSGVSAAIDSCRITVVQAVPGIQCAGASTTFVVNNTIHSSGGPGIAITATTALPFIRSNTIVGCAGDGIDFSDGVTGLQRIIGNMITDNGGYGIDLFDADIGAVLAYNRFRDNTSGATNGGADSVTATAFGHVTTDGGDGTSDYLSPSTDDYRLKATSPATSAGRPELQSIGAAQRDQTGGGGETSHTFVQ